MSNRIDPPDVTPPEGGQETRRFPVDNTAPPPPASPGPATPPPWEVAPPPADPTYPAPPPTGAPPAVPLTPPAEPTAVYPAAPAAGVAVPAEPTVVYPAPAGPVVYSGGAEPVPPPPPVPPPNTGVIPPSGNGPLPWIIGGVAALALLGLLAFLLTNNRSTPPPVLVPTATPTASDTPQPQPTSTALVVVVTATPGPATDTPVVPPTDTVVPPTDTPIPGLPTVTPLPTNTPVPPTNTPLPPTATPAPPTATPAPASATAGPPTPSGGSPAPGTATETTAVPSGTPATPPPAVGTGGPADAAPAATREGYLTVQWFGQSCFLIAGGEGVRILIDPVGPEYGYHLPFFDQLDALLISHLHPDHTFTAVAPGGVANYVGLGIGGHFEPTSAQVKTAAVRDVASYHDNNNGRERGENALWVIDVDGFHIVHLGDLGQTTLTDQQVAALGKPDILMIPVGDGSGDDATIDGNQARGIIRQLQPRLVIPMHYRTDRTPPALGLAPVEDFLGGATPARTPNFIQLRKQDLPTGQPVVQVMNYK